MINVEYIEALRVQLDTANEQRRMAATLDEWEKQYDDDGNYRYGSERTYQDLVEAVSQVYDDLQFELERDDDAILILREGETNEQATQRIDDAIGERAHQDPRMLRLVDKWGASFEEAGRRYARFAARQMEAFGKGKSAISPTVQMVMRQDTGLDDLLPGVEE